MANIDRLVEQRMKQIKKVIDKGCLVIADKIKKTLIYNIQETFYNMGYGDEHDLWESIDVLILGGYGKEFTVEVFFNDNKINHTSWFGSENLGISSGDKVFSVSWINDGWSYLHGSTSERLRDVGESPHFLEKTLIELQNNKSWLNDFKKYLRDNGIDIE